MKKIYADIVSPILEAKCVSCHGADKSKGKLRLHVYADIMKGGSDGETTVIAGNVKDSLLLQRIHLPVDDDDHMPPSDEPQVTKAELALLTWWIEQGASETLTVSAAAKNVEVEDALKGFLASKPAAAPVVKKDETPKAKPLTEEEKKAVKIVAEKMAAINASLMPIALDSEQLRFGCVNSASKFTDKETAELASVAPIILWADFARSKITDQSIAVITKMVNLERLHLENTTVTDAGVSQLAGLAKLEYLNLYGTKVTDAGIAKLAGNKALKKLFVWQTGVTAEGAKKLEASVPGLVVNIGLTESDIAKLVKPAEMPKPAETPKAAPPAKPEEKPPVPAPKPEVKPPQTTAAPKPETKPVTPAPAAAPKPEAKPVAPTPTPAPAVKPEAKPPAPAPAPAPAVPQTSVPAKPAEATPPASVPDAAKK